MMNISVSVRLVIIFSALASVHLGGVKRLRDHQLERQTQPMGQIRTAAAVLQSQVQTPIPRPSGVVVRVSNHQGADLGARINAADKALGGQKGWILVDTQGELRTQARISQGHTLKFTRGRFPLFNTGIWTSSIVLESDTAVFGEGIDKTVLVESENAYMAIESAGHAETEQGHYATGTRSNIKIAGFTVEGRNTRAEGGVRSTIELGNAIGVHIYEVHLKDTTCLGISAGGTGLTGKHAENWLVEHCVFEGVASQNLNVVNGQRITFRQNRFLRSGKICDDGKPCEGVTPIDLEPNSSSDIIKDITIEDNVIDSTDSRFAHGNGILVQNTVGVRGYGPVRVLRNRITGGPLKDNFSGHIYSGIYVNGGTNTTISGNEIIRTAHSGIRVENASGLLVERNRLVSTGTGGIESFEVLSTVDSRFVFNSVTVDPRSPLGRAAIVESGKSDRNYYEGNIAPQGIALIGKSSTIRK